MFFVVLVVLAVLSELIESNTFRGSTTNGASKSPVIEPRKSADCQPRPTIKDLGQTSEEVYPRNIKLYQCSGFDGSPTTKNQMCVPTKRIEVQVAFYQYGKKTQQSFYNETECAMQCVCILNGYECPNNPRDVMVTSCPPDMNWDYKSCKCVPGLGNFNFNDTETTSNGAGKSPDVLIPPAPPGISVDVFVGALVGEFLVMAVMGLMIYLYCQRQKEKNIEGDILMNGH